MSKKKSTMTLKDFHGGSIPSDLPLPSAPGITMRPMDRPVFDRPNPWGNPMGRSDHRLRPGSAGSVKNDFDDKTPFLGPNPHIVRHFDEDERKPLDGRSGPRRAVAEVAKPDYSTSFRHPPSQQLSSAGSSTYAGRVSEPAHGGPYPNAWAIRKEAVSVADVSPANWSGPDAASKLSHASALDKVSLGRWQSSKQPIHHSANVEPVGNSEIESSYHSADLAGGTEFLTVNDRIQGGEKVIPTYEKARSTMYPDKTENISHSGKFVGSVTPSTTPPEQSERPKLKLLPRSKLLESSEPPVDHNQGYQQTQNFEHVHQVTKSYETAINTNSGLIVADSGNLAVDRPKLNLKPRSQALEQVEETTEKGRNTVFGGARPRELVLKERGVDDIVVNNHDVVPPPNRVKLDLPRTETLSPHLTPSLCNGKPEGTPLDNRTRKNNDLRDNRVDAERMDMQKRNWRSENQRNTRETGIKHQSHQPPQERPPSPETWRKPVEEQRPVSSDGTGLRYGKAASAVELAEAFSKSVSDPKTVDQFPNKRGIPRTAQIPFSRLTDPGSRPQINGY